MRVNLVRAPLTATLLSALALSAAALSAAPATAGGPTSALLSIPGAGSTASLYYTDPEYDELAGLVGMGEPGGTFDGKESGGHEFGPGVTITWLVHDVEPWRVDHVYLGGKDGPWIATQVSGGSSIWESSVLWHRPANGARLAELLDRLGLGSAAAKDTSFDGVAGAPVPETADTTAAPRAAAEPGPGADDESTWLGSAGWAFGGLLLGALLTLAWTRRRPAPADDAPSPVERPDGYAEVLARRPAQARPQTGAGG
jgi:hypothetical protein